jgi:hypothetical protein
MLVHILHIPFPNVKNFMRNKYCLQCASDSRQTMQLIMQSVAQPCNMHNNIMIQQDIHVTYDFDVTPVK